MWQREEAKAKHNNNFFQEFSMMHCFNQKRLSRSTLITQSYDPKELSLVFQ